jgi:DNA-damage-inducible protein J
MMTENTTPLTTTPTTTISIRVKPELKKEAEELFDSCGLSLSQAFQVFLKQSIRVGGLPFIVRADKKPNPQTLMAMEETEALLKDPKAKKFSSVDELFEDLHK